MNGDILDKTGALERKGALKLDLGCGAAKRDPTYVGVDVLNTSAADVVGDVSQVLGALPEDRVQEIYTSHLLEHLPDLSALVDEVERVLTIGGRLHVVVPHFSNPYYYSDPTHRQPFGLYTFSYLAEDALLRRRVPRYGRAPRLRLTSVLLRFRSSAEFGRLRGGLKLALGRIVNTNVWTQELYEENFAGVVPCYELEFQLVKVR